MRLVQIDTPEVFFGAECYGRAASRRTKLLLPPGTRVRLQPEPASDRVDRYGRLLRYVVRARDGLNVNVRLVAVGAAAPYFYDTARAGTRTSSSVLPSGRGRRSSGSGVPVLALATTPTEGSKLGAKLK